MQAADRVLELFSDVLGGRKADPTILAGLCREHVPEGPYHEYKRGKWFDEHQGKGLRSYVSGFANAEGGVLILGIVGGEDIQAGDKWTFEAPTRPTEGWDVWLGKALSDVATKTRVVWNVVEVDQKEVVVIAANRAEGLIRVYEKPNLVCYLRVGEHTHPIPETLFADLALGRRAKPDLAIEQLQVTGSYDSLGFHLGVSLLVHNQGLLWVPGVSVAWCGYAVKGAEASPSLTRELIVRPLIQGNLSPMVGSFNLWGLSALSTEVKPFEQTKFGARIDLPVSQAYGSWAWYGAVMALPVNGSPRWAQVAAQGRGVNTNITRATALPPGRTPLVAWLEGPDIPRDVDAFLATSGRS